MRQERTVQATLFEVFAQHEIGCELKAMSRWLDGQRALISLVADDLRRQEVRETGRRGLPAAPIREQRIAAAAHRFLRQCVHDQFSAEAASSVRILYGGSVKPDNIQGLMAQLELDGALVGGASLDAKSFAAIVNCK